MTVNIEKCWSGRWESNPCRPGTPGNAGALLTLALAFSLPYEPLLGPTIGPKLPSTPAPLRMSRPAVVKGFAYCEKIQLSPVLAAGYNRARGSYLMRSQPERGPAASPRTQQVGAFCVSGVRARRVEAQHRMSPGHPEKRWRYVTPGASRPSHRDRREQATHVHAGLAHRNGRLEVECGPFGCGSPCQRSSEHRVADRHMECLGGPVSLKKGERE